MSFNHSDLLEFQESMTLSDFKNKLGSTLAGETYFFSNNPASNFLSLTHKFGFTSGGKRAAAPELSIEFIDPEGIFENKWFRIDDQALKPLDDDPLGTLLLKKKHELLRYQTLLDEIERGEWSSELNAELEGSGWLSDGVIHSDGATENNVEDYVDQLEDEKDILEDMHDDMDDEDSEGVALNMKLIDKQIAARTAQLQRPMWITYGIGNKLVDWSPVMCFDRCTKMEYSFTGGGARTLKLVYSGVGIHPNLSQLGIKDSIKGFELGVVFTGESNPMFNKEFHKVEEAYYKPLIAETKGTYDFDVWKPSIHKTIRDAIRRFIKQGIGWNTNVLCILPNLDNYLAGEMKKQLKIVRASMEAMVYQGDKEDDWETITSQVQATKEVLETCGLNFVEEFNAGYQVPVGANVWDRIENIEDPDKVMEWLQTKDLTAIISCDGVQETIQEKISSIMAKIKESVDDLGAIPDFTPYWYIETDYLMLDCMYRHFGGRHYKENNIPAPPAIFESNSVGQPFKPVVVVGDKNTILTYLQARIFDSQRLDKDGNVLEFTDEAGQVESIKKSVRDQINPFDVADGLTYEFMREIFDIQIPIPWTAPFGPTGETGAEDLFLPGDTNLIGDTSNLDQIKKEQPIGALRMPVFALGTKNPNVLSLDIDINKQYYMLMNSFQPQDRSAQQYTTSIMGKGSDDCAEVTNIFNAIAELKLNDKDTNGIPKGFEAIVSPYWDQNTTIGGWLHKAVGAGGGGAGGGEMDDLGGIASLFRNFGEENDMPELLDTDGKDFDSKADFIKFMWETFAAIGNKYKPKAMKQSGGKGKSGGNNAIMTAAKMASQLAGQGLIGTVTSTPMFHLANDRRVITRKALLYCIEPRFAAGKPPFEPGTNQIKRNLTWFSGSYVLTGFQHTINSSTVQSEFAFNRPPARG